MISGVGQRPAPGVEQHDQVHTSLNLRAQIGGGGTRELVQQGVRGGRISVDEALDAGEFAAALTFHHVGGERPGAAGKTDQWHAALQLAFDEPHGIGHIAQFVRRVGQRQLVDVGTAAQRMGEARTETFFQTQAQAHRIGNGQDVREQNRGVEGEPS